MFLKFNQKIDTIFLDTHSKKFEIEDKVNVIISPSLYWVKKVALPVKYIRDVKPLLVSLFEDILPTGNYSYHAYKKGNDFFIFAYEDKVVLDLLKNKGISSSQLNNIYLSQSEFDTISNPIAIDENQSLYVKNDLVILLPSSFFDAQESLDINNRTLSKHNIRLNQFGHIVNSKSLYTLVGIFSLLIVLLSVEFFIVHDKTLKIQDLKDNLFTKHSLKATMMQNRSMLKDYSSLHERQMRVRKYMGYMLSMNLEDTQKISLVHLKGKKLIVEFTGIVKGTQVKIEKELNKHGVKLKTRFKSDIWQVEMSV
ncbi:MAG: hypothetical protein ACI9TV_000265 [Sulfurimonas sp.]